MIKIACTSFRTGPARMLPVAGLLALMSVVLALPASGQQQGRVRLFIDPGDSYAFILDGKYRMQERELSLTPGRHTLTFWAPRRAIVDTAVQVVADSLSTFMLQLPWSAGWVAHTQELKRHRGKRFLTRSLPALATLGLGIWAGTAFVDHRNAYNELNDLEDSYSSLGVPREITSLKEERIPAAQDELARTRTTFLVSTGLFVAAAAGTWYAFRKTAREPVPVFEDKEKVRFDGLVWLPGAQGGTWAAGITVPIR